MCSLGQPDAGILKVTEGSIEFRDVHFHYNPEKPILQGLNFKVRPGQTLACLLYTSDAADE